MNKNYNFERKKLLLPEYGRHIHEMVDYLRTIPERETRNQQAHAVIAVMGNLNPVLRDTAEYTHKLWDHLFIMSDFQLDVDSPYPIPTPESLYPQPTRLTYPRHHIRRKHYGFNIQRIIRALEQATPSDEVRESLGNVARFMRSKSFEYNQEHPSNENIIKEIKNMSENGIQLDEAYLATIKNNYQNAPSVHPKQATGSGVSKKKRNGKKFRSKR